MRDVVVPASRGGITPDNAVRRAHTVRDVVVAAGGVRPGQQREEEGEGGEEHGGRAWEGQQRKRGWKASFRTAQL